jgi:hypothetical protein
MKKARFLAHQLKTLQSERNLAYESQDAIASSTTEFAGASSARAVPEQNAAG